MDNNLLNIHAKWMLSSNFGDALTPWMISHMLVKGPWHVPTHVPLTTLPENVPDPTYMMAGSILNWVGPRDRVWGTGLAAFADELPEQPPRSIHALRGPLTGAKCTAKWGSGSHPGIFGDPALCLPKVYDTGTPAAAAWRVGVVPHYVDQLRVKVMFENCGDDIKLINILQPIDSFINEIRKCEFILSTSLHGLVVAHAYHIKATWIKIDDLVGGDGMKFMDHEMSVGLEQRGPLVPSDANDLASRGVSWAREPNDFDCTELWNARPIQ